MSPFTPREIAALCDGPDGGTCLCGTPDLHPDPVNRPTWDDQYDARCAAWCDETQVAAGPLTLHELANRAA